MIKKGYGNEYNEKEEDQILVKKTSTEHHFITLLRKIALKDS